tara:strand:- start:12958 stop:14313 length:1356 start_codon:yes stop_codon:yes gene_type:complete
MGWTNLHNLIYYLFGISHLTNGKVSDEEKAATIKIAKEYFDESVDFESIYREIQGDYLKDMGFPNHTKEGWIKVQKQTIACAKAFATNSSGDATNNISFLLKDTIALFKSKGGFSEAEKNMIDTLAKHWNIDKDWLYDGVKEEENNLDEIIEDYLQNYNEESVDNEISQVKVTMEMIQQGFDGKGLFESPDGSKYEGGFKDGRFSGAGKLVWPDGENYNGEWKEGNPDGKGIYNFTNGDVYDGYYKNGVRSGTGKFTHGSGDWEGDVYEGEWKNDQRNGNGIITFGSGEFKGEKYDGQWKDGKRNGKGTYHFSDGSSFIGTWKDGELVEKEVELKNKNREEETSIEKIIREWNSEGMIEIEKKDFIHHLSIIYPELKENTIKTMITTMIVNKRTRTYYHGCKKPRKCSSQNNYDFLYLNDDNYLTKYDEGKHGLWEIYQRQDGKLDVRLIS